VKGEQNRDRAVERLLRSTRHETDAPQACVSAELLAAWSEGTLARGEARAVEAHASECDRCQAMLAAFARAEPGPGRAAEPFWHGWRLQWLAPAAAVATALAVWVAVPRERPAPDQAKTVAGGRTTPGQPRPGADVAGVDDRANPAEAAVRPPTIAAPPRESAPAASGQESRRGDPAAGRRDRDRSLGAAGNPPVGGVPDKSAARKEEDRAVEDGRAAANPPSAPSNQIGSTAAKDAARREAGDVSTAASAAVPSDTSGQLSAAPPAAAAPPPPAAPVTSSAAPARPLQATAEQALRLNRFEANSARVAFSVVSPDAVHRWRIDAAGQLQHSSSAGATWQDISLAAPDVLSGGMSPTGSVCWLVGRNGAVWLTSDGLRFDRRAVPQAIDLISVRATDHRRATVAASDGRSFVTTDGGVTWAPAAP
jgi:hypothetical protein